MLYQPRKVYEMWDTWMYYHKGTHYLFYLHRTDQSVWRGSTLIAYWDGISVATSHDGVHYEEVGPIIHKADDAIWLGSGAVWQTGSTFIQNFSENREGLQGVYFAESDDLIHWRRLGNEYRCVPDPRWYDVTPNGRWDCIWRVPKADGGYWGYLTARPAASDTVVGDTVGRVVSQDGRHWQAVPPPQFDWGNSAPIQVNEVGAVERIGERFYMIIGNSENYFGSRHTTEQIGGSAGMFLFSSVTAEGPFRPEIDAFRFLTSSHGATYFARFYPTPEEMLVSHHAIERCGDDPRIWMSPLKRAALDSKGHLRLHYWHGNDVLKGQQVPLDLSMLEVIKIDASSGAAWNLAPSRCEVAQDYTGALGLFPTRFDVNKGVMIEGALWVDKAAPGWSSVGFFIEREGTSSGTTGTAVLAQTRSRTEIGHFSISEHGVYFAADDMGDQGIAASQSARFRFLLRQTMIEFYLDDLLIRSYSLPTPPSGRLGLMVESGHAIFEDISAWEMTV